MTKKKITIENLAVMMQGGFVELRTEMTRGFSQVTEHLEEVDLRLGNIEDRLEGVEVRLEGVELRLGNVERRLDDVVDDHGHRLKKVELKVKANP